MWQAPSCHTKHKSMGKTAHSSCRWYPARQRSKARGTYKAISKHMRAHAQSCAHWTGGTSCNVHHSVQPSWPFPPLNSIHLPFLAGLLLVAFGLSCFSLPDFEEADSFPPFEGL